MTLGPTLISAGCIVQTVGVVKGGTKKLLNFFNWVRKKNEFNHSRSKGTLNFSVFLFYLHLGQHGLGALGRPISLRGSGHLQDNRTLH